MGRCSRPDASAHKQYNFLNWLCSAYKTGATASSRVGDAVVYSVREIREAVSALAHRRRFTQGRQLEPVYVLLSSKAKKAK
jgi:hypothetical protein